MDLIATSSHVGRLDLEAFPHTLTGALTVMQAIAPRSDEDNATMALSVWHVDERGGVSEEVEMARWHFQYIEGRWILLEARLFSSSQSVGAELPLYEEQLLATLTSWRHTNASLYIGDAEVETYASYLVELAETEEGVLTAHVPSALVERYKQLAMELGYELIS